MHEQDMCRFFPWWFFSFRRSVSRGGRVSFFCGTGMGRTLPALKIPRMLLQKRLPTLRNIPPEIPDFGPEWCWVPGAIKSQGATPAGPNADSLNWCFWAQADNLTITGRGCPKTMLS